MNAWGLAHDVEVVPARGLVEDPLDHAVSLPAELLLWRGVRDAPRLQHGNVEAAAKGVVLSELIQGAVVLRVQRADGGMGGDAGGALGGGIVDVARALGGLRGLQQQQRHRAFVGSAESPGRNKDTDRLRQTGGADNGPRALGAKHSDGAESSGPAGSARARREESC